MKALVVAMALLLAGCAESSSSDVEADILTPGQWHINGTNETMLVWAHNTGSDNLATEWDVSFPEGTPDGWQVDVLDGHRTLAPHGTKNLGASHAYPDWGWAVLRLTIPPETEAQTVPMEVSVGDTTVELDAIVGPLGHVLQPGDTASVYYDATFLESGEEFYNGTLPSFVGDGTPPPGANTLVTGVAWGLAGLAEGETRALELPPPLAYGYDIPVGHPLHDLSGEWLRFSATIVSLNFQLPA